MPQLDSYKGMIFATFDEKALPLEEFLGDIRWGLDLLLEQGVMKVGSVTRWQVDCNWKFAAESSVNDINHGTVHLGALHADRNVDLERELSLERDGFTVITEFGHGLNAEYMDDGLANADDPMQQWRQDAAKQRRLGQFRMQVNRSVVTLFPNAMLSPSTRELYLWHPRSVNETEVWMVTFYDEMEPPEVAPRLPPDQPAAPRPGRPLLAGRGRELGGRHEGLPRRRHLLEAPQLPDGPRPGRDHRGRAEPAPDRDAVQRAPPALVLPQLGDRHGRRRLGRLEGPSPQAHRYRITAPPDCVMARAKRCRSEAVHPGAPREVATIDRSTSLHGSKASG